MSSHSIQVFRFNTMIVFFLLFRPPNSRDKEGLMGRIQALESIEFHTLALLVPGPTPPIPSLRSELNLLTDKNLPSQSDRPAHWG